MSSDLTTANPARCAEEAGSDQAGLSPEAHWPMIRGVFRRAAESSLAMSIATVDPDGSPRVTPIGSLMLHPVEPRGYYFELFTRGLVRNLDAGGRVAALAVDSRKSFWLRSLFRGRFRTPPAVRLLGRAGVRRRAEEKEIALFRKRVQLARWTKGHDLLWSRLNYVRDLYFDAFEPVRMGTTTQGLWENPGSRKSQS